VNVLGSPQTVVDTGTEPVAVGFGSTRPTIPPSTSAPAAPVTTEALVMRALEMAERQGSRLTGWRGPVMVISVTLALVATALWGRHVMTGNTEVLDRLDALEQAHDDRIDHDAWVVDALQALSAGQPLPQPPKPTRRRLSRQR